MEAPNKGQAVAGSSPLKHLSLSNLLCVLALSNPFLSACCLSVEWELCFGDDVDSENSCAAHATGDDNCPPQNDLPDESLDGC